MTNAISGINIALWDLAGKILQQPVSVLLGGAFRSTVPAYGSVLFAPMESLPARIQVMKELDFHAIKLG